MFCFLLFGVQLKSQLTEQNKPFKFELSKWCDQEVFAIAILEEAKLGSDAATLTLTMDATMGLRTELRFHKAEKFLTAEDGFVFMQ